jgi:hypothetical protein
MTERKQEQEQRQQQIPCGDDRKKSKDKDEYRGLSAPHLLRRCFGRDDKGYDG